MITKETKKNIIENFGKSANNSGLPEVQVAIMTERISYLTEHIKTHKKDHQSRKGLLAIVGNRKNLLNYLKKKDPSRHESLLKELNLRK